ncbi:MAG: cyclic nucleotide-binding domain-containing protein [Paracoccaceae bacterium]|nr:cyclic nucleotide-binding domain-containing protein [Paracoccaceae bacterium]
MHTHGFEEILADHPLFKSLDAAALALLAGCARNEHFEQGATIYAEGGTADRFFILRHGDVAMEIATPERSALIVETLHPGDVFGWSWMITPFRHTSDARALSDVRAISLDGACLRRKCDENPALGYALFQNWIPHLAQRMRALRLQVLDLYGTKAG